VKFHKIAFILLVIGGLNWLLVGLLGKDLFVLLGMDMSGTVARIVYILVGVSALLEVIGHKKMCKMCDKGMQM
jgi:uncharacterized membrane protein YuzA (DUF378 family)